MTDSPFENNLVNIGAIDRIYVHSPDRLARNYAYQVLLFESHLCLPPIRSQGWQIDSRWVVMRYEGKVPAMASCAKCERKFFTPATFAGDAVGAQEYLGHKFDVHVCAEIEKRESQQSHRG